MRKLLLLGTVFVATSAMAFSGVFGGGGGGGRKSSGVDSIGVHVNGKDKANIDIRSCNSETEELLGNECCPKTLIYTDNDTTKCCSLEGYAVQDGKCKKQCGEGLVLNEETNDCEDACPAERQCGDVCCGQWNVCHPELNVCCMDAYEDWEEEWMDACCPAGSPGYEAYEGKCCEVGEILVPDVYENPHCCPAGSTVWTQSDGCCPEGSIIYHGHCCPADSPGWSKYTGCCPAGTMIDPLEPDNYCCPEGSTDWNEDDGCIQEPTP